jgi:hypothetical protein
VSTAGPSQAATFSGGADFVAAELCASSASAWYVAVGVLSDDVPQAIYDDA